MGTTTDIGTIEALYRQSLARPRQEGRNLLRGRLLLEHLLGDPDPRSGVEYVATRAQFDGLLGNVWTSMREELLSALPDATDPAEQMASSRDADLELLDRGVRMDLLYEPGWAADPAALEAIRELVAAGARARVVDQVPHRLLAFDRSAVLVPSTVVRKEYGAVFARDRRVVADLRAMFLDTWEHAVPLEEHVAAVITPPITAQDRRILELMGTGLVDESAARALEVSVRTYRRHVADLMERLGATSRFQAGVIAVRRGWL